MRIFKDNADHYLKALELTLYKDPASLEAWRCIHIHPTTEVIPLKSKSELLKTVEEHYKNADCDVVFCNNSDWLVIGKLPDIQIMNAIKDFMLEACDQEAQPETTLYDMFFNWREVREIILTKISSHTPIEFPQNEADFGEVASLQAIFAEIQKVKKARNPLHILFVEDDEVTRRLAVNLFKERYAVFTAKDAKEGIASYLQHAPDIVFLDINLPDHDGFQLLRQILANDPEAYVVMFSGHSYLDNIVRALNSGASGFVAKPFSREKMHRYIDDCEFANHKSH